MSEVIPIIQDVLRSLGVFFKEVQSSEVAGQIIYDVKTEDPALAYAHGDVLHALDHIVKKIVEHQDGALEEGGHAQFSVDVNGHRIKHIKNLEAKALMMAERARAFQYDVELTPMSSYERLIVHTALADAPHVKTESQGEGRSRRVVIKYTVQ